MKVNPQSINTTTILLVLIALVIGLTAYTVPIDSTMDVYIEYNIGKPLTDEIQINSLNVIAHPHTIMTSPLSGASLIPGMGLLETIAMSGEVGIVAKAGDIESGKSVGKIIRLTDVSGTLLLTKVPKTQKDIIISVYEGGKLIETQRAVFP